MPFISQASFQYKTKTIKKRNRFLIVRVGVSKDSTVSLFKNQIDQTDHRFMGDASTGRFWNKQITDLIHPYTLLTGGNESNCTVIALHGDCPCSPVTIIVFPYKVLDYFIDGVEWRA